jgi:predicted ArsR family transcriptional regulator
MSTYQYGDDHRARIAQGEKNRKQIALLLAEYPDMSACELGRCVGCSHEAARKHKRRILQQGKES